jgi:hypothetical protein
MPVSPPPNLEPTSAEAWATLPFGEKEALERLCRAEQLDLARVAVRYLELRPEARAIALAALPAVSQQPFSHVRLEFELAALEESIGNQVREIKRLRKHWEEVKDLPIFTDEARARAVIAPIVQQGREWTGQHARVAEQLGKSMQGKVLNTLNAFQLRRQEEAQAEDRAAARARIVAVNQVKAEIEEERRTQGLSLGDKALKL